METVKIFKVCGEFKMSKADFEIAKNVARELAKKNLYSEVKKFFRENFQNLDDDDIYDISEKFLKKNKSHFIGENLPNNEIICYAEIQAEISLADLDNFMKNFDVFKLEKKVDELQDYLDYLKDNYKEYLPQIVDLTAKITLNPTDSDLYFKRGKVYQNIEHYSKSVEDFTQAINLNPNFADAYSERGYSQKKLKNHSQAISDYTQAINLNPDNAWAYFERGEAHYVFDDYEKAIEDFTKTIELGLEEDFIYSERGECYKALGKDELAKKDLDKCNEWLVHYFKN